MNGFTDAQMYSLWLDRALLFLPKLGLSLLVLLAFWLMGAIAQRALRRIGRRTGLDRSITNLLCTTTNLTVLLFGIITACGTIGIDVAALVAGLGLTGFAVGLALKDVLSNLVSGVLILVYRPFLEGDRIEVSGFSGTVREVNLRYTIVRSDAKTVLIPNASLFTNSISILDAPVDGRGADAESVKATSI